MQLAVLRCGKLATANVAATILSVDRRWDALAHPVAEMRIQAVPPFDPICGSVASQASPPPSADTLGLRVTLARNRWGRPSIELHPNRENVAGVLLAVTPGVGGSQIGDVVGPTLAEGNQVVYLGAGVNAVEQSQIQLFATKGADPTLALYKLREVSAQIPPSIVNRLRLWRMPKCSQTVPGH